MAPQTEPELVEAGRRIDRLVWYPVTTDLCDDAYRSASAEQRQVGYLDTAMQDLRSIALALHRGSGVMRIPTEDRGNWSAIFEMRARTSYTIWRPIRWRRRI